MPINKRKLRPPYFYTNIHEFLITYNMINELYYYCVDCRMSHNSATVKYHSDASLFFTKKNKGYFMYSKSLTDIVVISNSNTVKYSY